MSKPKYVQFIQKPLVWAIFFTLCDCKHDCQISHNHYSYFTNHKMWFFTHKTNRNLAHDCDLIGKSVIGLQVCTTLLSTDVKKNRKMLQNIWQCQVRAWTIVHSYAKYCTCKPPSNWETRDSPFIIEVSSLKKPSLQCCQTINQTYNKLHMKVSTHFLHSHINSDGKYNMNFM